MRIVGMVIGICALLVCVWVLLTMVAAPVFLLYSNAFFDLFQAGVWNGPNPLALRVTGIDPLLGLLVALAAAVVAIQLLRPPAVRGVRDRAQADDAELLQEIHRGLNDLDKRVESLETILLDRARRTSAELEGVGR